MSGKQIFLPEKRYISQDKKDQSMKFYWSVIACKYALHWTSFLKKCCMHKLLKWITLETEIKSWKWSKCLCVNRIHLPGYQSLEPWQWSWSHDLTSRSDSECTMATSPWILGKHLTHWGRTTHICVGKLTTIGSDNGLAPSRRQAIIWTNAVMLEYC